MTSPKLTLRQWSQQWISSRAGELSQLTIYMNRRHLADRILPTLGDAELGAITPPMIADYVARRTAHGLAHNVVSAELRLLGRVLAAAVEAGHITANPCDQVTRPVQRHADLPCVLDLDGSAEVLGAQGGDAR